MLEVLAEFIGQFFIELLPTIFKYLGASLKWLLFLGQKKFNSILQESWNKILGFIVFVLLFYSFLRLLLI